MSLDQIPYSWFLFEVRKFHDFRGCCSFVKFNPSKKQTTHCTAELLADTFVKIKLRKTGNQPFAEFKHLEKNQLYGNTVADALSHLEVNAVQLHSTLATVDFNALAKAQPTDSELQRIQSSNPALTFARVTMPMCQDALLCDTSTGTPRPYVPQEFRRKVFDPLHGLSHPGIRATQRLVTARFVWPGINADVCNWTRSCIKCQRAKVQQHTTTPFATFNTPDVRFDQIHVNLVGPLPTSQGFTYLLTCVDRFTHWPEAIPIPDITAEAQAFISGWISRFGMPSTITTDRGQQFKSSLWQQLMRLLGSRRI